MVTSKSDYDYVSSAIEPQAFFDFLQNIKVEHNVNFSASEMNFIPKLFGDMTKFVSDQHDIIIGLVGIIQLMRKEETDSFMRKFYVSLVLYFIYRLGFRAGTWSYVQRKCMKALQAQVPFLLGIMLHSDRNVQPHSLGGDILAGIFCAILSHNFNCCLKEGFEFSFTSFVKETFFNNLHYGNKLSSMADGVLDGIKSLLEYFCCPEYITKWFDVKVMSTPESKQLCSDMEDFIAKHRANVFTHREIYEPLVVELRERFDRVVRKLSKDSFDVKRLNHLRMSLDKCFTDLQVGENLCSGTRVEPVGILIRGSPNSYKSILMDRIISAVSYATLPEDWLKEYTQNPDAYRVALPSDKFWENYSYKHWFLVADDLFQERDVPGKDVSEPINIIKLINTEPYCLKMADISQKNTVYFRSPFVIATTNLKNFDLLASIIDHQAVKRRFHLLLDVSIAEKYLDNKGKPILPTRDQNGVSVTYIPDDFWSIKMEREGTFVNYTLDDVILEAIKLHNTHTANYLVNQSQNVDYNQYSRYRDFNFKQQRTTLPGAYNYNCEYQSDIGLHKLFHQFKKKMVDENGHTMDETRLGDLFNEFCEMFNIDQDWEDRFEPIGLENVMRVFISRYYDQIMFEERDLSNKLVRGIQDTCLALLSIFVKISPYLSLFLLCYPLWRPLLDPLLEFFSNIFGVNKQEENPVVVLADLARDVIPNSGVIKFSSEEIRLSTPNNDVATKVINKYIYTLFVVGKIGQKEVKDRMTQGVLLTSNYIMLNFHSIVQLKELISDGVFDESARIVVKHIMSDRSYEIPVKEMDRYFYCTDNILNKDIIVMEIPGMPKGGAGVLKKLMLEEDYAYYNTKRNALDVTITHVSKQKDHVVMNTLHTRGELQAKPVIVNATWNKSGQQYSLLKPVHYKGNFSKGDCGSPVFLSDLNSQNRCIVGIHSAGDNRNGGFCNFLTQEDFEFLTNEEIVIEDEKGPVEDAKIESHGNLHTWQALAKEWRSSNVNVSQIKKAITYGKLFEPYKDVSYIPAKLHPFVDSHGNEINPAYLALSKYGKSLPYLSPDLLEKAKWNYAEVLQEHIKKDLPVLSVEEALRSFGCINQINPSSSPGFPMNNKNSEDYKLKEQYYKRLKYCTDRNLDPHTDEDYMILLTQITTKIHDLLEMYRKGIRPYWLYVDTPKDELLKKEKVEAGKVRLFSACPFYLLVIFRMYFGAFMDQFTTASYKVGSAIGVNPFSMDWNMVAVNLTQFGDSSTENIGAGDYSGFDTCQQAPVHEAILELIEMFYPKSTDCKIRKMLFLEITNSRHIFENSIYEWYSGLPSGNALTALVNTMYNNLNMRMCWFHIEELEKKNFNHYVYMIALGDDVVYSVHLSVKEHFNDYVLEMVQKYMGFTYTNELKTATVGLRTIDNVEFLKRRFKYSGYFGRYIAPRNLESIFKSFNWTKRSSECHSITVSKMSMTLFELSLHEDEELYRRAYDHIYSLKMSEPNLADLRWDRPPEYNMRIAEKYALSHFSDA